MRLSSTVSYAYSPACVRTPKVQLRGDHPSPMAVFDPYGKAWMQFLQSFPFQNVDQDQFITTFETAVDHQERLYYQRAQANKAMPVLDVYTGPPGSYVGWAWYKISPQEEMLATNGATSCAVLAIIEQPNWQHLKPRHYLGHVFPTDKAEDIVASFKGIDLARSDIYVLPGLAPRTQGTVEKILEALQSVNRRAAQQVKYLYADIVTANMVPVPSGPINYQELQALYAKFLASHWAQSGLMLYQGKIYQYNVHTQVDAPSPEHYRAYQP